jgi:D-alanyl-lipoteichoic acid acyltransferase DltB (MBOAT superfamily)
MREEIIVSGRMNPMVDPTLHIWHWQIPLYLFLGLAAGVLFFAALFYQRKEKEYPTAVKLPLLTLLLVRPLALFIDLGTSFFGSSIILNCIAHVMGCLDTDGDHTGFIYMVRIAYSRAVPGLELEIQLAEIAGVLF